MKSSLPLFTILFCFVSIAARAEETALELTPIIKEGTPADVLAEDPVLPAQTIESRPGGSGGLEHALSGQTPFSTQDTAKPGAFSQFRGLGRSAEDINVQTLGIPLNPPQGGGLSLAVFPQFLWSDFRLQQGPSLSAMDPRGVSGSLILTPWTSRAVFEKGSAGRAAFQISDQNFRQWSAGARTEGFALLQGYTSGRANGPSGSLSATAQPGGVRTTLHLLASDIDAEDTGSASYPTPRARFRTQRYIPVLQADFHAGAETLVKTSFFYDRSILKYEDPDSGFMTHDRALQYGAESALLWQEWKFGLSARQISYEMVGFIPPSEGIANLQATRSIESGDWLIEPTVIGVAASRFGILPEGSLGVRRTLSPGRATFGRLSFSRNVPSLQNRYYTYPGLSVANPDLQPEYDYTAVLGVEWKGGDFQNTLQAFWQRREDAQVRSTVAGGSQVINQGSAALGSLTETVKYSLGTQLDLMGSVALTTSRLEATGLRFQYLPDIVSVFSLNLHPEKVDQDGVVPWSALAAARFSTSAQTQTLGREVAGYGTLDLEFRVRAYRTIQVLGRVDNVFDRRYETFLDYPNAGRVLSMRVSGEF